MNTMGITEVILTVTVTAITVMRLTTTIAETKIWLTERFTMTTIANTEVSKVMLDFPTLKVMEVTSITQATEMAGTELAQATEMAETDLAQATEMAGTESAQATEMVGTDLAQATEMAETDLAQAVDAGITLALDSAIITQGRL